jgi:hypothetical protein
MKLFILLIFPYFLWAEVHYAKVEPYETIVLKSSVNALVLSVDMASEGEMIREKEIIVLDSFLDKRKLKSSKDTRVLLKKMLLLNKDIAQSLNNTLKRKESYYQRLNKLSTASKTQKDNAYTAFSSTKTQYLGSKEKLLTLENQIIDLDYTIVAMEDSIQKKSIIVHDKYIYKIFVRKGDFVNAGAKLLEIKDMSRGKLILFLDEEEFVDIEHKIIYLDNKKSDYKIDKIWRVSDEKFISSYRAELIVDSPEVLFSKLVKIEIK